MSAEKLTRAADDRMCLSIPEGNVACLQDSVAAYGALPVCLQALSVIFADCTTCQEPWLHQSLGEELTYVERLEELGERWIELVWT
jgi:hypothetical protein